MARIHDNTSRALSRVGAHFAKHLAALFELMIYTHLTYFSIAGAKGCSAPARRVAIWYLCWLVPVQGHQDAGPRGVMDGDRATSEGNARSALQITQGSA